jgi:hypothetical protein
MHCGSYGYCTTGTGTGTSTEERRIFLVSVPNDAHYEKL